MNALRDKKGLGTPPAGKPKSNQSNRKGVSMFGKSNAGTHDRDVSERPIAARGGVSLGTILTGALVAIGAFFLLSSIVGAVLSNTGVTPEELSSGEAVDAGVAGGIALLVALFLSFLWGGYTAGRFGRGSGFLNGLLVPIGVIILGAVIGAITWALGASDTFSLPSPTEQLQIEGEYTSVEYGLGLAAITLGVIFVSSILGGMMGARWHTKLERRVETEHNERLVEDRKAEAREVDVREREQRAERDHAHAATRAREAAAAERGSAPATTGGRQGETYTREGNPTNTDGTRRL